MMDPVKRFVLNENKFNDDFTKYTEKISYQIVNNRDKQLFGAIINYAKQTGITDLFVVDEEFVKTALLNEVERRKGVSHSTPIADVAEVKHGHNATNMHPVDEFVCSECGFTCTDFTEAVCDEDGDYTYYRECEFDYCPKCGAKMDKN